MAAYGVAVLFLLGTISQCSGQVKRRSSEEETLLKDLFTGYNPAARPVMNSSKTVSVSIHFSLMHIKELDVRSQVLTTTGLLILDWVDERLTWEPRDYGDMQELIVEADSLWTPEFAVINGAEKIYENYSNFRAIISSEGVIHWEPGGVFKTMCNIDITYYPFDEQECDLMFGAWSYHTRKMNLTSPRKDINMDSYNENGEWQIIGDLADRDEFAYDCCPDNRFAYVAFRMLFRRRHTFYIMNVILPSILTSVLLLSIFFCTPGQKVQIGVVVLLSFRIFLLNVSDNIPKTSDHIPLLGIYLTCTMAITTLSMVLTVFVLNLHHVTDRPVPRWISRLVLVYIARLVGKCSTGQKAAKSLKENGRAVPSREPERLPYKRAQLVVANDKHHSCVVSQVADNECSEELAFEQGTEREQKDSPHTGLNQSLLATDQMNYLLTTNQPQSHEGGMEKRYGRCPDYAGDWKKVAEVFDRLFFWLFFMAITLSTLVLFHPLTDTYVRTISD